MLAEEDYSDLQPKPALTSFLTGWMEFFGGTTLTRRVSSDREVVSFEIIPN